MTPEVLWNLAPWSWAVDWFTNTGDVVRNISEIGSNGLVLRDAYLMHHAGLVTVDHATHPDIVGHLETTRTVEIKLRRESTPYGFGFPFEGLSLQQKAIITALGLSKWK
jgi:hypothetical protein